MVTSDVDVELWKMRKLIKSLDNAKGYTINNYMSLEQFEIIELKRNVNLGHDCFFRNGTSMISLIIPQNGQLSIVNKMLTEEMGTAARIKSRVNRQSVQSAISSVQQRLKLYKAGLCMFCIS